MNWEYSVKIQKGQNGVKACQKSCKLVQTLFRGGQSNAMVPMFG